MKRVKRRYLAVKLDCEVTPTEREFIDAVWAATARLYGEVGASQTSLSMIDFDAGRQIAVLKVSLATLNMLRASLASVTSVAGKPCSLRVLSVSGTLKALASSV